MYRSTFEIFAKFIAKKNDVSLAFDMEQGACADLKNNVLHLPKEIANDNACGAIALTMHEAAHIKHSKSIPIKELCPMQSDFHILNAIEDVRIDLMNFRILPNVFGFYEELVRKLLDLTKSPAPEPARRLCGAILYAEGFSPIMNPADQQFVTGSGILGYMHRGCDEISRGDWKMLKVTMDAIKKLLNIDPKQDQPNTQMTITVEFQEGKGQGQPQPQQAQDGQGKDKDGNLVPQSKANPNDLSSVGKMLRPTMIWSKGERMPGGSALNTNPLAMDEQCANQFKEILNIKECKIIKDGGILDTGNLVAYYTGDIDSLFVEDIIVRKKKSKVMFLMDSSSSMSTRLLDGKSRGEVVKSSVQKLTQILNEVSDLEGINVDWAISDFSDSYRRLTKDNWQREYTLAGGTSFQDGFMGAMEDMVKDYTIEGKRIIVVFTDGDVGAGEIDNINKKIVECHSDVRSLVIGVGSDMNGHFVKNLTGDNVIIAEANATEIIMEVIKEML